MGQAKIVELALVKDPVAEINELHQKISLAAKTTIEDAIRIGELLTEQRKACKHGEWLDWLKENVPFTQKTANKYMHVYGGRSKLELSSNLADAYRIVLPKKPKLLKTKAKSLEVHMFLGVVRIEEPLPNWHVVEDVNQQNHQTIICTKCWTHSTGGQPLSTGKQRMWIFECRCPQSVRTAPIKQYSK